MEQRQRIGEFPCTQVGYLHLCSCGIVDLLKIITRIHNFSRFMSSSRKSLLKQKNVKKLALFVREEKKNNGDGDMKKSYRSR